MKKSTSLVGASCVLALLVGCQSSSTTASRIQEKSSTYAALPPEQQQKVQSGVVEAGYTGDMVYMALGRPTKVSVTTDGKVGIWTYEKYYPTEAVSGRPLYLPQPAPWHRAPMTDGYSNSPSSPGGHPNSYQSVGMTPRETYANRSFAFWSSPDYTPVTLHVLFAGGRVTRVAVADDAS